MHEGDPGFASETLPRLRALPLFREATPDEIDRSYEAYLGGDTARLLAAWAAHAEPVRAALPPWNERAYRRAGLLPRRANGMLFLVTSRAVLAAGERFRARLRPRTAAALRFPWLLGRHEHVPPGYTPPLEFPREIDAWVDRDPLDEARARWQLLAALNEVQQSSYSHHLAALFRLPELERQAERERELARNYFAHWSPPATRALWAQAMYLLDAMNASVFHLVCLSPARSAIAARSLLGAVAHGDEWRAFVAGLERPQRLLQPPSPSGPRYLPTGR
jgi:hypothetical protein